jgi:hypothetical protein
MAHKKALITFDKPSKKYLSRETIPLSMYAERLDDLLLVWDELGVKYEGTDYLIGKMDATVNEIEGYPPVHSFPTIRLYRKDGTQVTSLHVT